VTPPIKPLVEPAPPGAGVDFYYNFHEGQQRAYDSPKRFILVLAGSQGGKTSFGPLWLAQEIDRRGDAAS
jgi:hypothetical protein